MGVITPGNVYVYNASIAAFDRYDIASRTVTAGLALSCGGVSAAAVLPDGTAIGSQPGGQIVKFDPATGACQTLFVAPEWIDALAVSANGMVVGQSHATSAGVRQIYRFSANGAVLSKAALNGVAALGGIAYSPTGKLYATAFAAPGDGRWYSLFAESGTVVTVATGNQLAASDICIDGNGIGYGHAGSTLYAYDAATGAAAGSLDVGRDLGIGAVFCR